MDVIIHFVFWGVVEHIFFRIGRLVLRYVTLGHVKLENPTPIQIFLVAPIGLVTLVLGLIGTYILFGHVG